MGQANWNTDYDSSCSSDESYLENGSDCLWTLCGQCFLLFGYIWWHAHKICKLLYCTVILPDRTIKEWMLGDSFSKTLNLKQAVIHARVRGVLWKSWQCFAENFLSHIEVLDSSSSHALESDAVLFTSRIAINFLQLLCYPHAILWKTNGAITYLYSSEWYIRTTEFK